MARDFAKRNYGDSPAYACEAFANSIAGICLTDILHALRGDFRPSCHAFGYKQNATSKTSEQTFEVRREGISQRCQVSESFESQGLQTSISTQDQQGDCHEGGRRDGLKRQSAESSQEVGQGPQQGSQASVHCW
jgi:hypothetical protein